MPQITLLGLKGIPLKEHAIMLTKALECLDYDAHFIEDVTTKKAKLFLANGDVNVTYKECNESDIETIETVEGVTVWVDTPVEKADKLNIPILSDEDYLVLRNKILSIAKANKWKVVTYNSLAKLQPVIEQVVLVNLIYTKSGVFNFSTEEPVQSKTKPMPKEARNEINVINKSKSVKTLPKSDNKLNNSEKSEQSNKGSKSKSTKSKPRKPKSKRIK